MQFFPIECCSVPHCSTNERAQNELQRRWCEAGQPESPDWEELLKGL